MSPGLPYRSSRSTLYLIEVVTSPCCSLTQRGQASVTLQPDSGLFNSLGAGVVQLAPVTNCQSESTA